MKKFLISIFVFLPFVSFAQIELSHLRVNGLVEPMGVNPEAPVAFSWIASSADKGASQSAYEVSVYRGRVRVWHSGVVKSENSVYVPYEGKQYPDSRYSWSVRIWDNKGRVSKLATSTWHTGLRAEDWQAEMIGEVGKIRPVNFRCEAALEGKIKRATAYITSHGQYEAFINGQRVGESYMTPGWTSFSKRLQYQAYDVTTLLQSGKNVVAAVVAPGWYTGMGGYRRGRRGDDVALMMQVNIEYANGRKEVIATDESWSMSATAKASGVVENDIYNGATINANLMSDAWTTLSYVDRTAWEKAQRVSFDKTLLVATENEHVKTNKPIKPLRYIVTPKGEKVIDFGQNIVGWERVKLQGKSGDTIHIYHAETLDENGNFYTTNLRKAKAASHYVMNGGAKREFAPTMTFYGFRYIKVVGVEGDLNLEDYEAVPVWSNFDNIGSFSSSNPLINQLQSNIWWGFHDNFLDVPTDCPQRDERVGWTGDAQVFFRTASFLGRVDTFFKKWFGDIRADQFEDGTMPRVFPHVFQSRSQCDACGWADAVTIIPWKHYMAYGDKQMLADNYNAMKKWVDYLIKRSRDNNYLWVEGRHFGDWLFYSKENDCDGKSAVTSKHLIAQCFFAHSLDNVVRAAEVLGKVADVAYYKDVATKVRKAYQNEYVTPNGLVSSDTQTAYVLALHFDMLPDNLRKQAAERLVNNIKRYKYHITTGFLGTPYICEVLTRYGHSDVAYKLLLQEGCPGWLYQVKMGATTIWERWDSIRKDGSIPDNGMNSLNHYSYGSIGDWLYRSAVGIQEAAAGYKRIVIKPHTGGNFESMEASTITPYGKVSSAWKAKNNVLTELSVEIPFNTTAEIYIPAANVAAVVVDDPSVRASGEEQSYVKYAVGSGKYTFSVK